MRWILIGAVALLPAIAYGQLSDEEAARRLEDINRAAREKEAEKQEEPVASKTYWILRDEAPAEVRAWFPRAQAATRKGLEDAKAELQDARKAMSSARSASRDHRQHETAARRRFKQAEQMVALFDDPLFLIDPRLKLDSPVGTIGGWTGKVQIFQVSDDTNAILAFPHYTGTPVHIWVSGIDFSGYYDGQTINLTPYRFRVERPRKYNTAGQYTRTISHWAPYDVTPYLRAIREDKEATRRHFERVNAADAESTTQPAEELAEQPTTQPTENGDEWADDSSAEVVAVEDAGEEINTEPASDEPQ